MEPLHEQQLEITNAHINYVRCGSGTPLVFLHNGGGFWQSWEKQLRFLSATHDCIALDWPGFGKSTHKGKADLSLGFYSACLHEVLNKLGITACILIGNCIGASVAVHYKQQHPERVTTLVLLNICPGRRIFPNAFASFMIRSIAKSPLLRRAGISVFGFFLRRSPMKNKSPRILFGSNYNAHDPLVALYNERFRRDDITRNRAGLLFAVDSFTLGDFLKTGFSSSDVFLFWGAENRVTPFEKDGPYHGQLLGNIKPETIPAGGHLCMYECAETMNDKISQIITKNIPG